MNRPLVVPSAASFVLTIVTWPLSSSMINPVASPSNGSSTTPGPPETVRISIVTVSFPSNNRSLNGAVVASITIATVWAAAPAGIVAVPVNVAKSTPWTAVLAAALTW